LSSDYDGFSFTLGTPMIIRHIDVIHHTYVNAYIHM